MLTELQISKLKSKRLDLQCEVYVEKDAQYMGLGYRGLLRSVMNRSLAHQFDLSDFITPNFSEEQANEVLNGLRFSLPDEDIKVYSKECFTHNQMYWIRHGFMSKYGDTFSLPMRQLDPLIYASPNIDDKDMRSIYMWLVKYCKFGITDLNTILSLSKLENND